MKFKTAATSRTEHPLLAVAAATAAKEGLSTLEIPVKYRDRLGVSKVTGTFSGIIKAGTKIIYTIFKYLLT